MIDQDPHGRAHDHIAASKRPPCADTSIRTLRLLSWVCVLFAASTGATGAEPSLVCRHGSAECRLVNEWFSEGTAAGNAGDHYDNRDRGHSRIETESFPQVQPVSYTADERSARRDFGAAMRVLPHVTIGNSSTAARVDQGGCQARLVYYVRPSGIRFLHQQYRSNNLYVYPEHQDHDPGHNGQPGYGDLLPTNTPYLVLSQGSSGSDKVFVRAFLHTLAAFRPHVKERLRETGLLVPAVQMIFRQSLRGVRDAADYLTGKAHPSVFRGDDVDPVRMVRKAHEMTLETVPPLVQLLVLQEDQAVNGRDFFEPESSGSEKLADTPSAIARIFRTASLRRQVVITAEESVDLNRRPLTFHWVVLRGDPDRIQIEPLGKGAVARITVAHHPRLPVAPGSALQSNRVDIGVFAHNGASSSPPAFFTVYSLDNEGRVYDDHGRIRQMYYDAGDTSVGLPDVGSTRWGRFLDKVLQANEPDRPNTARDLGSHLVHEALDPAQRAALVRTARLLGPLTAQHTELGKELEQARAAHSEARSRLKHSKAQGDGAQDAAVRAEKSAASEVRRVQKEVSTLSDRIDQVLRTPDPAANVAVPQIVAQVLNTLKGDPSLYAAHAAALDASVRGLPDGERRQRLREARQRLVELGLLRRFGRTGYRIAEGRAGGDLGPYERYQVERFNLALLSEVLFPQFLESTRVQNFVDPRLTSPKTWRDLYHYDREGALTGWTRYDRGDLEHFTALGTLVVRRDSTGRVLATRAVKYAVQEGTLKAVPVGQVVPLE